MKIGQDFCLTVVVYQVIIVASELGWLKKILPMVIGRVLSTARRSH